MRLFLSALLLLIAIPLHAQTYLPATGVFSTSTAYNFTALETFTSGIYIPQDSKFLQSDSPPENWIRLGNRTLVGDATQNPDTTTIGPCVGSTGDWFTNFEVANSLPGGACAEFPFFTLVVESKSNNGINSGGILATGQGAACTGNCASYGGAFYGFANKVGGTNSAWGVYMECEEVSANQACLVNENELNNYSGSWLSSPDPFTQAGIDNIQLGCGGGGGTTFNCQTAIQIVNGGKKYYTGINFLNTSLITATGPNVNGTATTPAITMPTGYEIVWFSAANTPQGYVSIGSNNKLNLSGNSGIIYCDNANGCGQGVTTVCTITAGNTYTFQDGALITKGANCT